MESLRRLAVALFPLATVPVLFFLVADGYLNFGGGEKDLLLVAPFALWALLFAISSLWLWARRWPLSRATARSALVGFAGVLLVGALLVAAGQLGIAGRA